MKIAGFVKTSLIDYPGKVAAVVFTQGCNFRCGFCHNPELLPMESKIELYNEKEILEYLKKRRNILDGVVITGGEPTLQKDLVNFLEKLKELGLLVKLDTNGSNPEIFKSILEKKLVDYIAMDIKTSLEKYNEICGFKNVAKIKESVKLIMDSGIDYEFRTTVLPTYHNLKEINMIGELIKGAKKYVLQGFRPKITYLEELKSARSFTLDELQEMKLEIEKYVKRVIIIDNIGS